MSWVEKARHSAAAQAVRELRDRTTVGLGSGTTVLKALDLAAERIKKEHLYINWVPTSYQMEIAARRLSLKVTTLSEDVELDLALDGADQVQWRSLDLVKGGGAALLREKIVDSTTKKLVIIIDERKLAKTWGENSPSRSRSHLSPTIPHSQRSTRSPRRRCCERQPMARWDQW